MKFIRLLLRCLALAVTLLIVLFAALWIPAVQTWAANLALSRQSAVAASLGSLSAGLGKIEAGDLQLKADGAVLILPSLTAEIPLYRSLRQRKILVRGLVARGWTLDLGGIFAAKGAGDQTGLASAPEGVSPAPDRERAELAQKVIRSLRQTLGKQTLPCDFSLDGVDLEGDILFAWPAGRPPSRIHVVITGGGMAAGRQGSFALDVSSALLDEDFTLINLAGHGRVALAMNGSRTFSLVDANGDFSASGGPVPDGLTVSAKLGAAAGGRTGSLSLIRGGRQLAAVRARLSAADRELEGTWSLDLKDSDFATFASDHPLPPFGAKGEGRFDSAVDLTRAHAQGRLSIATHGLGALAEPLDRLGATTLKADFDATRSGPSIQVDRLNLAVAGPQPIAVFRSLQPFAVDGRTGEMKPADPARDWMAISIQGFPLASLPAFAGGFALSGGAATGELMVRAEKEGFALRSLAPLRANGVSVQRAGRTLLRNLDLALSLTADRGPQGWQIQAAPLTVENGGHRLATVAVKASRAAGPDQPLALAGKWSADLQALAAQAADPSPGGIGGRSATGDFSATADGSVEWNANLVVTGRDPTRTVTASAHAIVDPDGTMAFQAPIKFAFGSRVSDLSADGTWTQEETGPRLDLRLAGQNVVLENLRLLVAPLAAAGITPAGSNSGLGTSRSTFQRDLTPFWGDWVGRISFAFDQLTAGDHVLAYVGGGLQVNRNSLQLQDGRGRLPGERAVAVEGSLSFDPTARHPYDLKMQASLDRLEAGELFSAPEAGGQPAVEGKFSIAGTATGNGVNLGDLAGRMREEFRLTGKDGIVRLLTTDVHEAIPQAKTSAVSDTLGAVGSVVGGIFGVKKDRPDSGENPVTPAARTAIAVTLEMAEIGYDQLTITATREPDRTIRLVDIAMTTPDERFTGSGEIAGVPGLPLRAQALDVNLQLWAGPRIAKMLSKIGLLSTEKDDRGYAKLIQPIHLGGTIGHVDVSQWHELLVQAARGK